MLAIVTIFLLSAATSFADDKKILVEVYYESLCPDSKAFVTNQLGANYKDADLQNHLNISLIPYGKSTTSGVAPNYSFECHHGENECNGNKYHACAVEKIKDQKMLIPYISCFMMNTDKSNVKYEEVNMKCGKEVKIMDSDIDSIKECSGSNEGLRLLSHFGNLTQAYESPLTSVPAVRINGGAANTNNRDNFRKSVCDLISGTKPAICSKPNGASALAVFSFVPVAMAYIVSRL